MENWVDKVKGFGRDPTDLPKVIYYFSHKLLAAKLHTCGFEVVTLIAQKMKLPSQDFISKCDQIHSFLWIWSHLLKKFSFENFIFMQTSFLSFLDQIFIDKNVRYKK